ncbi:MAG: DegQ family serine endoprotease [Verrucomicrobia bacterium]|nr:DegQ family serine endoprotease [Verrucomicrobiota bacterium]
MRKSFNQLRLGALVLGSAGLCLATGSALSAVSNQGGETNKEPLQIREDDTPLVRDVKEGTSFASIVQKVAPSVVKVFVTMKASENPMSNPDMEFFRRFFGGEGLNHLNPGHLPREHGLGSGVIVSPDGYILTNNHVVNNASEIEVTLNDGRHFTAKVIGTDPQTDVALVKINAENLPALTLTDSSKVEIGDVVLAIGNPFGIGQTVTKGIVSAKDRTTSANGDEDFIQTDAAINPGNSGGALVDTDGRLIGINSSILTRSGGNQGIGFAVPADLCRWVMDSLVKNGRVERGLLGITIQNLTPDLAQAFKLDRATGALVGDVSPGSPADKAGLKSGDLITRFNGQPVQDASQLKLRVAETAPGSKVPVVVNRNGQDETFDVTLGSAPESKIAGANGTNNGGDQKEALAGVGVIDLDQNTRSELNIPGNIQGAVISKVAPDSPAYEAGLRRGDVITELNRQPVKNAQDAVADAQNQTSSKTLVKVWTQGGSRYLTVEKSNQS